jgi:CheY-like chemotaxis protein
LGIGLALVKGLVELHQGTIDASSAGPGLGSEFVIRLPRSRVVADPSGMPDRLEKTVPEPVASDRRVLVADDNRDAADSLARLLEVGGYRVAVAYSGDEAVRIARREKPQAMILDIGMPGLTGYEVARLIRSEPWAAGVHLIAVTGWGQAVDKAQAHDAGFDRHLTKPFDPDQVDEFLRVAFKTGP